jgi:hypothetical protein
MMVGLFPLLSFDFYSSLYATLCYDSRALDEREADAFMSHLRVLLAEPETMLSGTEGFNNVNLAEMDLY